MSFEGKLTFHCDSDVGVQRQENQDFFGFFDPSETSCGWLFVVADGMGGAAGGATASRMAVAAIRREYKAHVHATGDVFDSVRHAIEVANDEIHSRSQLDPDVHGMGTTANVVVIKDDVIYTAHVGDSRTYRYRDGRLERLTRDHTQVQELVDQGIITPGKARHHPQGHIISRNLGSRAQVTVDIPPDGPFRIRDGDVFLVCSDGLYGLVDDEAIAEILDMAPPERATPALIELANRRGGHDNITVCVVCAGTPLASWNNFSEARLKSVLDTLQSDRPTDTATFNVQYQDALEPSDFETSRLRAVTPADVAAANSAKPLYSRAPNTVQEMGASQARLPPAPAAAPPPVAPLATTQTMARDKPKSRVMLIVVVIVLFLLGALLATGLVVGYLVLGKGHSKAVGVEDKDDNPPATTATADADEDEQDEATDNEDERGASKPRPNRRRKKVRPIEPGVAVDKNDQGDDLDDLPLCEGMDAIDPEMTAPYVMRLENETQDAAIVVSYRPPERQTSRAVRCKVNPGDRVRLPRTRDMLTFTVMSPASGELQCSPRYEGIDPVDVHLKCTAHSDALRGEILHH